MTSIVAVGSPAAQILATAKRLRSDLIVIGTQGLSGVQRLVFGSTTEQVLRRTTIPVMAVPPQATRRSRSRRPLTVDAIIVPINLAGEWASDAVRGAAIAQMFNVPIRLVHVLRPVQTPIWIRRIGVPTERQRIAKATRTLEHLTRQLSAGVRASCSVVLGDPAHESRSSHNGALRFSSCRCAAPAALGTAGRNRLSRAHPLRDTRPRAARRQLGGPLATRLRRAINETLITRDRIEMAGIDALFSAGAGGARLKR